MSRLATVINNVMPPLAEASLTNGRNPSCKLLEIIHQVILIRKNFCTRPFGAGARKVNKVLGSACRFTQRARDILAHE